MGVLLPEAHGSPSSGRILCEGTELSVALPGGRVLRSLDLAGIVLDLRSGLRQRIDAVERGKGQEASLWFYTFSVQQTDGTWSNLCLPGPDGRQAALPIPGRLAEEGLVLSDGPEDFQLSCTAGALAKCLRYGYRPWERAPKTGRC